MGDVLGYSLVSYKPSRNSLHGRKTMHPIPSRLKLTVLVLLVLAIGLGLCISFCAREARRAGPADGADHPSRREGRPDRWRQGP